MSNFGGYMVYTESFPTGIRFWECPSCHCHTLTILKDCMFIYIAWHSGMFVSLFFVLQDAVFAFSKGETQFIPSYLMLLDQ